MVAVVEQVRGVLEGGADPGRGTAGIAVLAERQGQVEFGGPGGDRLGP